MGLSLVTHYGTKGVSCLLHCRPQCRLLYVFRCH